MRRPSGISQKSQASYNIDNKFQPFFQQGDFSRTPNCWTFMSVWKQSAWKSYGAISLSKIRQPGWSVSPWFFKDIFWNPKVWKCWPKQGSKSVTKLMLDIVRAAHCKYTHANLSIYIYIYAYRHTYIHTYINTYIHTYILTYIPTYILTLRYITLHYITWHDIALHAYITKNTLHTLHYITSHCIALHYITINTYIHTYMHTYIPTYIPTYIRTYVRTYIRTYIHTHIHTHTCVYIYFCSCNNYIWYRFAEYS